jgi:ABC-type transporter Mla subunit MlaD
MPDYADTLAELVKARDVAKELLSELRGATKDARGVKRETMEFLAKSIDVVVKVLVDRSVKERMDELEISIGNSAQTYERKMASGTEQVLNAFIAKEKALEDTVGYMNRSIEIVSMLKETIDSLVGRIEHLEHIYHTTHQVYEVTDKRLTNLWTAMDSAKQILDAQDNEISYLFGELGLELNDVPLAKDAGSETSPPDDEDHGASQQDA